MRTGLPEAVPIGIQGLLFCCGSLIAFWLRPPWPSAAGLLLFTAFVVMVQFGFRALGVTPWKWLKVGGWITAVASVSAWGFSEGRTFTPDADHAALALIISAVTCLGASTLTADNPRQTVRALGMFWGFVGASLWLSFAYEQNRSVAFHLGVVFLLLLLIVCKAWIRLAPPGIILVNTLILLAAGLPLTNLFFHPASALTTHPDIAKESYSYEAAMKDPEAFERWWNFFLDQWHSLSKQIIISEPSGPLPFRMRPGSHGKFFESLISINTNGFRGQEISPQKGGRYRIVCLGESTTFGCTLKAEDKPWPELLDRMIRDRLHPRRPYEVINAGVPSYDLRHNLYRLAHEILLLKPDLLISYHGCNGFPMLYNMLPPPYGMSGPAYRPRPVKLLAECEYRLKLFHHKRQRFSRLGRAPPAIVNSLETPYAAAYRDLIQITRTNHIRLVLASFSMAVNRSSEPRLIEFYRRTFPTLLWQIKANEVHSRIVQTLATDNPEVSLVNTQPALDGKHEFFIDIVHFTQAGREQMAELFFNGIKTSLEQELSGMPSEAGAPKIMQP